MEKVKAVVAIAIVVIAVSFGVALCVAGCDPSPDLPPCGPGTHQVGDICVADQCVAAPPPTKTAACKDHPSLGAFCVLGLGKIYWPGFWMCATSGLLECTPHCYEKEKCGNNVDDNCDGQVDEKECQ